MNTSPRIVKNDALSCLICEVIVRRQDQEQCASITRMIRHYVARRAQVTEGHPHNAELSALRGRILMRWMACSLMIYATPDMLMRRLPAL